MKIKTTFFTLILGIIVLTVKSQTLNLNDLIQCHKKSEQELTDFLKMKSRIWVFKGHDVDYTWWTYEDGYDASFIKKTDGNFDNSEIIVITNNTDIPKTILANIKAYGMQQDGTKSAYVGKNYVVLFVWLENNKGETIFSIHLMTKKLYYSVE
jgi:hypothetical protein